jgi:UDP-glucose 4-epimerase
VQANLLACEAPRTSGRVFNIGTGTRVNLNEVVAALGEISGRPLKPRYDPPRDGDIRDSQADISHARAVLGYEPTVSLEEGLHRTFNWYRATQAKSAAKS